MKLEELLKNEFEVDSKTFEQARSSFPKTEDLSLNKFSNNVKKYQKDISDAHSALLDGEKKCKTLYDKRLVNEADFASKDKIYNEAKSKMAKGHFYDAYIEFAKIKGHRDATQLYDQCEATLESKYKQAAQLRNETKYAEAIILYEGLSNYKNSRDLLRETEEDKRLFPAREEKYKKACGYLNNQNHYLAYGLFKELGTFKDSQVKFSVCEKVLDEKYQTAINMKNRKQYVMAVSAFDALYNFRDAVKQAVECRKAIQAEAEAARRAERMKKQRRKDAIAGFFAMFFLILYYALFFVPIVFSVVFGIILFSNTLQISIVSGLGGWVTLWVFFTLGSIILTILAIKWIAQGDSTEAKSIVLAVIAGVYATVGGLVTFINSAKLQPNFNPANDITLVANSKENLGSNSAKIYFNVQNSGSMGVSYFQGEMKFYKEDYVVSTYTVYFRGSYFPGCNSSTSVEFTGSKVLCNTSLANLKITYKIDTMSFYSNDSTTYDERQFSVNGDEKVIKDSNKTNPDGNPPTYTEALTNAKEFAGSNVIFPDGSTNILEAKYTSYYSQYDYSSYDAYYVKFEVPSANKDKFQSKFVTKLQNKGYYLRSYDSYSNTEYRLGDVVIAFSDITVTSSYCYMDYYVFNI